MSEIIGVILITVGLFFDLCGCIGLVRFPDVYNRLQASTKCVTLGTILLLMGVAIMGGHGAMAAKALICGVFIMFTSPTAAHAIARGSHMSGISLWEGSVIDLYADEIDHPEPKGDIP